MGRSEPAGGSLAHYGVKGMKWGVRRSDPGGGSPSRKVAKADKKFEKNANSSKTRFEVYNNAARHVNKYDVDRINNKPEYKGKDFTNPSKLRDKYYKEHTDALIKALGVSAKELGTNASGTRRYDVKADRDGSWTIQTVDVEHADEIVVRVIPEYDALGHILSLTVEEPETLKHYGVKGMKWGVRKSDSGGGGAAPVRRRSPASEDAKAAEASQRKLERGGTRALTTKELQNLVQRMNLEQQYSNLSGGKQAHALDKGHDFVKNVLGFGDTGVKIYNMVQSPAGKALRKLIIGV